MQRFASGAELAVALAGLIGSSPQVAVPSGAYAAHAAPTTLSSAAGAATASVARKRTLPFVIAGLGVAAAGVAAVLVMQGGANEEDTTAAGGETPAPTPEDHATTTGSAVVAEPSPESSPPRPEPPDLKVETSIRMKSLLASFVAWTRTHGGAPCPDGAALGVTTDDPWGHPFKITCSDQPGDQMVGAMSAGPDGAFGTNDDIVSWQLGHDVTDVVRGARWVAATPTTPVKKRSSAHSAKPAKPPPPKPAKPAGGVQLDENGLPISR